MIRQSRYRYFYGTLNQDRDAMKRSNNSLAYKAPTSKDVATLAGVSQTTVSFVINDKKGIAEETRKRVLNAMRILNYHPNVGARILKTSHTNIIALFAAMCTGKDANETTPYIDAIVRFAGEQGCDVILNTTDHKPDGMQRLANKSICDAFILMDILTDDPRIPIAAQLDQPTVLIGRPRNACGLDVVDLDTRAAARLAVQELIKSNHHHIAVVGEPLNDSHSHNSKEYQNMFFLHEFYTGIREECEKNRINYDIVPRLTADWNGFSQCGQRILKYANDRLGIIVRQPGTAQWLLWYLRDHNIQPGKDVSIIAHCSDEAAISSPIPLSNISTIPQEVATTAVKTLFKRLNHSEKPQANKLPTDLSLHTNSHKEQLVAPSYVHHRATTITAWQ